jgi:hypothetical protein
VGQRALPNAGQQILKLRKCLRSELSAPFALNLLEYFVDFLVCGMSAFGKTDNTHPALVGGVGTRNIPQAFQASEQLVHGLFAHPGTFGEYCRADSVRPWKLENRDMRQTELVIACGIELGDDAAMNCLGRNEQQGADEYVCGLDGVMTWTVNGKRIEVGPGQALCIPRGAIHRFDNNTTRGVKALCMITPAAIGPQYFRETAAVFNLFGFDSPPLAASA